VDPLIDPQMAEWLRQKKEALGRAYAEDESSQRDADRAALLMQFAQSYVNKKPTAVAPRQVQDARSRFASEYGLEKDARGYSAQAAKPTDPDNDPAPAEWGAPAGMSKSQAIQSGYVKSREGMDSLEPDLIDRAKKVGVPTDKRKREAVIADILAAERAGAERSESSRREREKGTGETLKTGGDLRKEYLGNPMVRRTQEMAEANEKIQGTSPTGPGDISLLVAYMKMVDPGSTVRENEFATAENAGGVSSKLRNVYNKLLEGDKLPPQMREQFRAESRQMFGSQRKQHERFAAEYRRLAQQAGLNPQDVVLDIFPSDAPSAGAAPVAGRSERKIVERRRTRDGRVLVKYEDGTIAEEGK
jgi:hypothetical protein